MKLRLLCLLAVTLLMPWLATAQTSRFFILTDVHVTPGNTNDTKLREAVDEINHSTADAVLVLGDLTNEGSDEQLLNVKSILDGIRLPAYFIPGNHENNWSQSATKTFIDLWGNDRFVTEINNLVIVGCNCGPFMKMGDGHVKQEDLHWLKATLDSVVSPGKMVVSVNHYPLRKDDLDNYADYIRILEKYPTIIHLNGHYHRYIPYPAGDIQGMMVAALDRKDEGFGYSIVDVAPDSIHVFSKALGAEPELKASFPVKTVNEPLVTENSGYTVPDGFTIEKLWTDSASIFTRLGIDSRNLYFGNSLGHAKAIDKKTGELKWTAPTGASLFSRPESNGVKVYIPGGVHALMVMDAATGEMLKSIPSNGAYAADGLIVGDNLYQGGYKKFEKWDMAADTLVWRLDSLGNYCQAAPVVDGNELFFGAWDTFLRAVDATTGELLWKWNNGKSANMLGPGNVVPVVTDSMVIIVAPDRYMTAIDRKTGKTIWRVNNHKYRESLGRSTDGKCVYAKTMDGELVIVDATSPEFRELACVDMKLGYEHAPCIVAESDGIIYAGSRSGKIAAVDGNTFEHLWTVPVGVSEVNGIDIDPETGDVYCSLIEGTVFRINKK